MNAPRVMVVEDERIVALNLCRTLNRLGYNAATVVSSGEEALRSIGESKPDVVLMDIHIEGEIDGIETAARIPEDMMLPVIYLTAYSEDATLERARLTRPYGYLVKPFSERELHATITMALQRRESDVAVRQSEERLRLALAAAELGSWEIDPDSGRIYCKDYEGWLTDTSPRLVADSAVAAINRRVRGDGAKGVSACGPSISGREYPGGQTSWQRAPDGRHA